MSCFQLCGNRIQVESFSLAASILLFAASFAHADSLVEVRTIDVAGTGDGQTTFQQVNFNKPFAAAPVVVALPTNEGSASAALRIKNVTATGFQIAPIEPSGEDGQHAAMTGVTFIAVAPGTHTLGGTTIEANFLSTASAVGNNPPFTEPNGANNDNANTAGDYDNITFSSSFTNPAVLAAIQSDNNESASDPPPGGPSSPWMTTVIDGISGSGFKVALQRSEVDEDNDGLFDINAAESIGWIAIESGSDLFTDDGGNIIELQAFLSDFEIEGWEDPDPPGSDGDGNFVNFASGAFANVPVVIATIGSNVGRDGGWLRRGEIQANGIFLTVDEDAFNDAERGHGAELASILAFSQDFNLSAAVPEPSTILLWLIMAAAAALFAWRRRATGQRG